MGGLPPRRAPRSLLFLSPCCCRFAGGPVSLPACRSQLVPGRAATRPLANASTTTPNLHVSGRPRPRARPRGQTRDAIYCDILRYTATQRDTPPASNVAMTVGEAWAQAGRGALRRGACTEQEGRSRTLAASTTPVQPAGPASACVCEGAVREASGTNSTWPQRQGRRAHRGGVIPSFPRRARVSRFAPLPGSRRDAAETEAGARPKLAGLYCVDRAMCSGLVQLAGLRRGIQRGAHCWTSHGNFSCRNVGGSKKQKHKKTCYQNSKCKFKVTATCKPIYTTRPHPFDAV